MANWYMLGTTGTITWNTNTNWNRDSLGSGITGIPAANEVAILPAGATGPLTLSVVTTSIASPMTIQYTGSQTATFSSVSWATTGTNIIENTNGPMFFGNAITGSGKFIKRGAGYYVMNGSGTNTYNGGFDIEAGDVVPDGTTAAIASSKFGSGAITMLPGTGIGMGSTSTGTYANSLTLNGTGTYKFNYYGTTAGLVFNGATSLVGTPVIDVARSTTFGGAITGSAGFTKAGAGTLSLVNSNPSGGAGIGNTLSGTVTVSAGSVLFGNWVTNTSASTVSPVQLPAADISIGATGILTFAIPATTAYTTTKNYSGDGILQITGPSTLNAAGLAFTGSIASLGPAIPDHSKGLLLYANQLAANNKAIVTVNNLPNAATFYHGAGGASTTFTQAIYMASGATAAAYPTKLYVRAAAGTIAIASTIQRALYANQSLGAIELQGGIDRVDEAGSVPASLTFHLGGSNSQDNKISGPITNTSSVLAITKIDVGKWILSGNNTYTGTTTLSAGTLEIGSQNALSKSTLDYSVAPATATLSFSAGVPDVTFGGLSGSLATTVVTIPATVNLSIGNNDALTTYAGAIVSTVGFTKVGTGQLTLTNVTATNNITGTITVNAGGINCGSYTVEGTQFKDITSVSFPSTITVSSPQQIVIYGTTSYTSGITSTSGSGGRILVTGQRTGSGITFVAGALDGLSGQSQATNDFFGAQGFGLYADSSAGARSPIATINDLPSSLGFGSYPTLNTIAITMDMYYTGAAVNKNTKIFVGVNGTTNYPAQVTHRLHANGSGALKMSGGLVRGGNAPTSGTATFTLTGTSLFDNELSGSITEDSARVLNITKANTGRWILSGAASSYTGTTAISAGTLTAASNTAFGSSAATATVTLASGATMGVYSDPATSGINLTKTLAAISLNGGKVQNERGTNTVTAATSAMTASTTFQIDTYTPPVGSPDPLPSSLVWAPVISAAFNVTKTGPGTLKLSALNSYTGVIGNPSTVISAGTLEITTIKSVSGGNSSLGAPTTIATGTINMAGGTTLKHSGTTADSTDRAISITSLGSITLDSSGTVAGAVDFLAAGALTWTSGVGNSLVLSGSSTNTTNIFRRNLVDTVGGALALTKNGAGYWQYLGSVGYAGTTTIGGTGEFNFGNSARTMTGPLALAGGRLTNGASTVEPTFTTAAGGSAEVVLAGTGTFTANSGTTALKPNNVGVLSNTFSGNATVNATATVDLYADIATIKNAGIGKVLGNGTVSIENGGTVRTAIGTVQRGQARYKSLTLKAGSILKIGYAA